MSFVQTLRDRVVALRSLLALLRDPNDTPAVFRIVHGLRDTAAFRQMVAHVRRDPDTARLMDARHLAPPPDLDALLGLPPGSLGHEYAAALRRDGLDAVFYPSVAADDELGWLVMRIRQTHDVWHIVTGFGVTPSEELGLQAFGLAQLASPLARVLIAGALLRGVFAAPRPGLELEPVMDAVARGWRLGRAARPLIGQRWEDAWDRPVSEWRRALDLPEPLAPRAAA